MEIEYSNEVRGKVHAYRFNIIEREIIAKAFNKELERIDKQIRKIENDPKNEGQVTYSAQVDQLWHSKKPFLEIVKEFSK